MVEWTPDLDDYLANMAPLRSDAEIARELTRILGEPVTAQAVRARRYRLDITKAPTRGRMFVSKSRRRSKDWQ